MVLGSDIGMKTFGIEVSLLVYISTLLGKHSSRTTLTLLLLDMGNCLDYTNTFENNQSPGRSNFLFLERMYGKIDGSSLVNRTEGLYCSSKVDNGSSTSSSSKIFKTRVLRRQMMND